MVFEVYFSVVVLSLCVVILGGLCFLLWVWWVAGGGLLVCGVLSLGVGVGAGVFGLCVWFVV